jgi:hypothetical protein
VPAAGGGGGGGGGGGTVTITYTHDGWNRLVKVDYSSQSPSTRAEYRYNGLNWRVLKLADTSTPPDMSLNQKRLMYYSGPGSWQLLEERIDDDVDAQEPNGVDRHMQYVWMAWSSPTRNDHVARRGSAAQYHGARRDTSGDGT